MPLRTLNPHHQAGATDVVDWLLEQGVDIASPDGSSGDSPLHKAARNKHYGIYKKLVTKVGAHACVGFILLATRFF